MTSPAVPLPDAFAISPAPRSLDAEIQHKLDQKTKPPGALGDLEALAARIARVQQTLNPVADRAVHLVFASDHGITAEKISPYPQSVTAQMVLNFLAGGAAINVFCRHHQADLKIINAGVAGPLPEHSSIVDASMGKGTGNFRRESAMTSEQLTTCLDTGAHMVDRFAADADIISLGEMGIGNTTTGAALVCALYNWPSETIVGAGTGASDTMQTHKARVVREALQYHRKRLNDPLSILTHLGGFEIAMMTGAYLRAAALGKLVVVDGFIASSAWALAHAMQPAIRDYGVFAHESAEKGHRRLLQQLNARPLLKLNMRLGEGTGAVAALPLLRLATAFFNEMASFEEAGVDSV